MKFQISDKNNIIDAGLLCVIILFMLVFFDVRYLFYDTVVTGGDTASWHGVAHHMLTVLLPNGRLTGWDMGNLCGYPNFTFYFIPPFLLAVLPSYLFGLSLTITLKLAIMTGIFLLPIMTYFGLKTMQYRFPVPVIGSCASLIFLFNESYTMFGGNALSTFAGEFCYMFAFAFFVYFIGSLYHGLKTGTGVLKNGLLLGFIGLSHLFVFIPAVFLVIYWSLAGKNIKYLVKVSVTGFGLMAFWILPLIASRTPYTTPVYMIWQDFVTWRHALMGIGIILLLAGPRLVLSAIRWKSIKNDKFNMFLGLAFGCLVMYFSSHFLQIPDIRFLPPLVFILIMIVFAETLGPFLALSRQWIKIVAAMLVCTSCLIFVLMVGKNAPAWFAYNNKGYENTAGYEEFMAANNYLKESYKGSHSNPLNAPRVAYEKCDAYGAYGGDRAFESLPFFSGRQTMEGVHYASSFASRFIAFLQTEYSRDIKTPTIYIFSKMNPEVLPRHFDLYNISQLILMTNEAKKAIASSSLFEKEAAFGAISIYRYKGCNERYVDVPGILPIIYTGKDWVDNFYKWYKNPDLTDVLLVPEAYIKDEDDRAVFAGKTASVENIARFANKTIDVSNLKVETDIEHLKIRFTTNKVGVPHLIKVSYFPNWKVSGANGVYPVSPNLMMVIPRQPEVILSYGYTLLNQIGIWITCATLIIIFLLMASRLFRGFEAPVLRAASAIDRCVFIPTERFLIRIRPVVLVLVVLAAFAFSIGGAVNRNKPVRAYINGNKAFNLGNQFSSSGNTKEAQFQYEKAIATMMPIIEQRASLDHHDVINCLLFTAMCHENLDERDKAESIYRIILSEYPYSRFTSEAHVKIARIRQYSRDLAMNNFFNSIRTGDVDKGLEFLELMFNYTIEYLRNLDDAIKGDPYSVWASYAKKDASKEWLYIIQKEMAVKGIDYLAQRDKNRVELAWEKHNKKLKAFSMNSIFIQGLQKRKMD
jgi:tetratricopeptide (TPR) repeat protein